MVSHGHEDHIGGIPFLLEKIPEIPVYATPFALALIKSKCEEHGILDKTELHVESEDLVLQFDKLSVSFFRTTHSIPDTLGIAVHTPLGAVVFTGDFKFDLTPVMNQPAPNFQRMAQLGEEGVLALLSDSTNAEVPQFTKSERFVAGSLHNIITGIKGRIILPLLLQTFTGFQPLLRLPLILAARLRSLAEAWKMGSKMGLSSAI